MTMKFWVTGRSFLTSAHQPRTRIGMWIRTPYLPLLKICSPSKPNVFSKCRNPRNSRNFLRLVILRGSEFRRALPNNWPLSNFVLSTFCRSLGFESSFLSTPPNFKFFFSCFLCKPICGTFWQFSIFVLQWTTLPSPNKYKWSVGQPHLT